MAIQILDKTFVPYITEAEILLGVRRVVAEMTRDLKDENPILICVLKGALFFFADILENIHFPYSIGFCKVSSYVGTLRSDKIRELLPITRRAVGRTLVFVEDIVESGETMALLRRKAFELGAKDVRIASLFLKPGKFHKDFPIDYIGFSISDEFIVGYGLDYNEEGRNLPEVYQLKSES